MTDLSFARIASLWGRGSKHLRYARPKKYDTNLVVIGAGSGGLVSAYIASALQAKVCLIEQNKMGGDCLNTGCVPSKALIQSARIAWQIQQASHWGLDVSGYRVDFKKVMQRVHDSISAIAPHDSIARYRQLGVDVIQGRAEIIDPYRVQVGQRLVRTRNIIIATGAHPRIPDIPGLRQIPFLTSDNLWELTRLPQRLVVLGGGVMGCEMAQAFSRLGSKVTLIQRNEDLLPVEDREFSQLLRQQLEAEGVVVKTACDALAVVHDKLQEKYLIRCKHRPDGEIFETGFDQLLVALGRKANTSDLGLHQLDIRLRDNGMIETNDWMQTNYPNIYAVGDVCGPLQLTHAASHQAWYASINALFGQFKSFRVDYRCLPMAIFCYPEIARVGLNERQAKRENISYEITCFELADLDRAIVDGETLGLIKVLTIPGKDKILGVTIAAPHAASMIAEFVSVMRLGKGLKHILSTIHLYPGYEEANKYVAGKWRKHHQPQMLLRALRWYHRMLRS